MTRNELIDVFYKYGKEHGFETLLKVLMSFLMIAFRSLEEGNLEVELSVSNPNGYEVIVRKKKENE